VLCATCKFIRVAQRIKKQSMDYTSVKNVLIQFWRYKTLAVIKRHKNHLSLSLTVTKDNRLCCKSKFELEPNSSKILLALLQVYSWF